MPNPSFFDADNGTQTLGTLLETHSPLAYLRDIILSHLHQIVHPQSPQRRHVLLERRGPGDMSAIKLKLFSARHTFILRIVCVAFASVSIVWGLLTLFWFCRMKKRFRHK